MKKAQERKLRQALESAIAELPKLMRHSCPPDCRGACCAPVMKLPVELSDGKHNTGWTADHNCEHLDPSTRKCRVYAKRPFICRCYGLSRHPMTACKFRELALLPYDVEEDEMDRLLSHYLTLCVAAGVEPDPRLKQIGFDHDQKMDFGRPRIPHPDLGRFRIKTGNSRCQE